MPKGKQVKQSAGGYASKKARGLVQAVVAFTPAEREYIKAAAPLAGAKSMQDFLHLSALIAAGKVLPIQYLREIEKKMAKELDKSD